MIHLGIERPTEDLQSSLMVLNVAPKFSRYTREEKTFWAYSQTCTNPEVEWELLERVREASVKTRSGFLNTELDFIQQAFGALKVSSSGELTGSEGRPPCDGGCGIALARGLQCMLYTTGEFQ